jgi:predicted nucleic acid-binding protein
MRALLDVNVLIALLDGAHVHHVAATGWLHANVANGWASCPLRRTDACASFPPRAIHGARL